jgi:hypothetical protein
MTRTTVLLLAATVVGTVSVAAQAPPAPAPAPAGTPAPAPAPASIALGTRVGVAPSSYEDGNRRDPFASLIAVATRNSDEGDAGKPIRGLPGLVLADVVVRGVVKGGASVLAILEGPNRQSFVARVNDRLRDASVQSIDATGVVFAEQVTPGVRPISVRKTIRPAGEDIK